MIFIPSKYTNQHTLDTSPYVCTSQSVSTPPEERACFVWLLRSLITKTSIDLTPLINFVVPPKHFVCLTSFAMTYQEQFTTKLTSVTTRNKHIGLYKINFIS